MTQKGPERGGVANAVAKVAAVKTLVSTAVQNGNRLALNVAVFAVLAESV
jgi:hypothetical protein